MNNNNFEKNNTKEVVNIVNKNNYSNQTKETKKKPIVIKALDIEDFAEESRNKLVEYLCYVCTGVYDNPTIDSCGHIYCNKCLTNIMKDSKICPISSKLITATSNNIPYVSDFLGKQKIKCKNHSLGCNIFIEINNLDKHLAEECDYQKKNCPYFNCEFNKSIINGLCKKDLKSHILVCDKKTETCKYCNKNNILSKSIQSEHYLKNCPNYEINCSLDCGETILRKNMETHQMNDCKNTLISCTYDKIGCNASIKRKNLNEHLLNNMDVHNMLLIDFNKDIEEKILQKVNNNISEKINEIVAYFNNKINDIKENNKLDSNCELLGKKRCNKLDNTKSNECIKDKKNSTGLHLNNEDCNLNNIHKNVSESNNSNNNNTLNQQYMLTRNSYKVIKDKKNSEEENTSCINNIIYNTYNQKLIKNFTDFYLNQKDNILYKLYYSLLLKSIDEDISTNSNKLLINNNKNFNNLPNYNLENKEKSTTCINNMLNLENIKGIIKRKKINFIKNTAKFCNVSISKNEIELMTYDKVYSSSKLLIKNNKVYYPYDKNNINCLDISSEFAISNCSLSNNDSFTWSVSIGSSSIWLGIGLCQKEMLQNFKNKNNNCFIFNDKTMHFRNFKDSESNNESNIAINNNNNNYYSTIRPLNNNQESKKISNHGCFLLCSNGYTWNSNLANEDKFCSTKSFCIKTGSTVVIVYNKNKLHFNIGKHNIVLNNVYASNNKYLNPCIMMNKYGDEAIIGI